jgi:hypothetical protein
MPDLSDVTARVPHAPPNGLAAKEARVFRGFARIGQQAADFADEHARGVHAYGAGGQVIGWFAHYFKLLFLICVSSYLRNLRITPSFETPCRGGVPG